MGRLGLRAAVIGSAYAATALIVVASIIVLRGVVDAGTVTVVLAAHFAASLAAGLEPGTTKALMLGEARSAAPDIRAVAAASAIKAVAVTPVLAAVWWIASSRDLALGPLLCWSLPLCVIGFLTTDLRVLLDVAGRYAAAIWLKQGSLSIGILSLLACAWAGYSVSVGLAVSVAARTMWLAGGWALVRGADRSGERTPVAPMLRDRHGWNFLATSVLGALGASLDRICAFRFLSPDAAAGYVLIYELLSKFWLLPYLLGPIIFARRVAGQQRAGEVRRAIGLVALAGAGLVFATVLAAGVFPAVAKNLLGELDPVVAPLFAAAVGISSVSQLLLAKAQSDGFTRQVTRTGLVTLIVSLAAFPLLTIAYGGRGVGYAWLIRATLELILLATIAKERADNAI